MNKKTHKALEDSIAHWSRLARGKAEPDEDVGTHDCALCRLFFADRCQGCPVALKVGRRLCIGTPYMEASYVCNCHGRDSQEFKVEAKRELRFLKSLRRWSPRKPKLKNK